MSSVANAMPLMTTVASGLAFVDVAHGNADTRGALRLERVHLVESDRAPKVLHFEASVVA